jgi:hypothetical protein
MKKATRLKKYVELFKKNIEAFLAPNITIKTTIYPVEKDGAVFEFIFNSEGDRSERLDKLRPSVGAVLASIPQRLVSGGVENVSFGGTNIYMEGNRLLLIKGEDSPEQWSGVAIKEDVRRVVSTSQGGARETSR